MVAVKGRNASFAATLKAYKMAGRRCSLASFMGLGQKLHAKAAHWRKFYSVQPYVRQAYLGQGLRFKGRLSSANDLWRIQNNSLPWNASVWGIYGSPVPHRVQGYHATM